MQKHIYTLLLLVCTNFISLTTKAQYVTIPDSKFVDYLEWLYPSCMNGNQLDTICAGNIPDTALFIFQEQIKDLTGIQYFDQLKNLASSYNPVTTLPALPPNLTRFFIRTDSLTYLPPLPAGLLRLEVPTCRISQLPPLPAGLVYLDAYSNELTSLPDLPLTLTYIDVGRNKITSFPVLPPNLQYFDAEFNNNDSVPSLPASLTFLAIRGDSITYIPPFPAGLDEMRVGGKLLTYLPPLPQGITILTTTGRLIPMPLDLPLALKEYTGYDHAASTLPQWPPVIEHFGCENVGLATVPPFPASLKSFGSKNNLLTVAPELTDSITYYNIMYNPINCLPRLGKLDYLNFEGTNVTCVPNYGQVSFSVPALGTVPLCNAGNNNHGCPVYWNISGRAYQDELNPCVIDVSDNALKNVKVQLWQAGNLLQQTFTLSNGWYEFTADTGLYEVTVDTTLLPFNVACPGSNLHVVDVATAGSSADTVSFGVVCRGNEVGVLSAVADWLRPARNARLRIYAGDMTNAWGANCAGTASGTVTVTINGPVQFIMPDSGALTPDVVNGQVITYNVNNFQALDFKGAFNMIVRADTTATTGTPACFTITIATTGADYDTTNNTFVYCTQILASCDPNNKMVSPVSDIDVTTTDGWLTYTVNFQNTGNDTAFDIYITDVLDADVDRATFQLLSYSHAVQVKLKDSLVRFNFDNILLVDSHTNEPGSHGFVQYRIKLQNNLPVGTVVDNTAAIYFDYNAPVITNTTYNTLVLPAGVAAAAKPVQFGLYPNPATDVVIIATDETLTGGTAIVRDLQGRRVAAAQLTSTRTVLNTGSLSAGVYMVTVTGAGGESVTRRLIIEH